MVSLDDKVNVGHFSGKRELYVKHFSSYHVKTLNLGLLAVEKGLEGLVLH